MKRLVIVASSIVAGYALATLTSVALWSIGIDIPASLARTWRDYNTYSAVQILVLWIAFAWGMYQVFARRFLPRSGETRPFVERLPSWMRHPTLIGLVVVWVVAVFTVVLYPAAIYMSWRFYVEWRDVRTKICPRCAERVKAAALICHHCSHSFEAQVAEAEEATLPSSPSRERAYDGNL